MAHLGAIIEIQLTEYYEWRCTCQDTLGSNLECVRIRPALAEIGCDDAKVNSHTLHHGDQAFGSFIISRRLTSANASCKLRTMANCNTWRLGIQHEVRHSNSDYSMFCRSVRYDDNGDKITDDKTAFSLAFSELVGPTAEVVSAATIWSENHVSDVLWAAESFGLTYRDIMYSRGPSGNLLHKWADFAGLTNPFSVIDPILEGVRTVVEPSEYRQMMSERNGDGDTPYDIAIRRHGADSPIARLFQLTGVKSAVE